MYDNDEIKLDPVDVKHRSSSYSKYIIGLVIIAVVLAVVYFILSLKNNDWASLIMAGESLCGMAILYLIILINKRSKKIADLKTRGIKYNLVIDYYEQYESNNINALDVAECILDFATSGTKVNEYEDGRYHDRTKIMVKIGCSFRNIVLPCDVISRDYRALASGTATVDVYVDKFLVEGDEKLISELMERGELEQYYYFDLSTCKKPNEWQKFKKQVKSFIKK